jgi:hypothetical protein
MAKPYSYMIQIKDTDIEPMIKALAAEDMRTIGNQAAWLIRREYRLRHAATAELNAHEDSIANADGESQEVA